MCIKRASFGISIVFKVAVTAVLIGCGGSGGGNDKAGGGGKSALERGSFTDFRNCQTYKTVTIGKQTWMAENLNYAIPATSADSSWCYGDDNSNCAKYGRLYNWYASARACPSGWKLPDRNDWNILMEAAGGTMVDPSSGWYDYYDAGKALKSTSGWYNNGNDTDDFGFSALPGGNRYYSVGSFNDAGGSGNWWSATEYDAGYAYFRGMVYYSDYVSESYGCRSYGFSVRCVAVAQD